eukprot:11867764-Prorocentrum_lima.AAC.1
MCRGTWEASCASLREPRRWWPCLRRDAAPQHSHRLAVGWLARAGSRGVGWASSWWRAIRPSSRGS